MDKKKDRMEQLKARLASNKTVQNLVVVQEKKTAPLQSEAPKEPITPAVIEEKPVGSVD